MYRIELEKFYEKRIKLRIVGKISLIKNNKACLKEVQITRCRGKQKCVAEYDHIWIALGEALDNYNMETGLVSFNCFIVKYSRLDGTDDFSVVEACKFKTCKDKTLYLKD